MIRKKTIHGVLVMLFFMLLLILGLSFLLTMYFSLSYEPLFMTLIPLVLLFVVVLLMSIFLRREKRLKSIKCIEIIIVAGIGVFTLYLYLVHNHYYRSRRGLESTTQNCINEVGGAILSYVDKYGRFPDKNRWCDIVLMENEFKQHFFSLGKWQTNNCGMAFNENLSDLKINEVNSGTVLLIEANGPWNFAGGQGLLKAKREKDEYYPDRDIFIFIYFVDSTLVKYRLRDGAIALYEPNNKDFTNWLVKGQTKYLPLKW